MCGSPEKEAIHRSTLSGVYIYNNSIILPITCAQHSRESDLVTVAINCLCGGLGGGVQMKWAMS